MNVDKLLGVMSGIATVALVTTLAGPRRVESLTAELEQFYADAGPWLMVDDFPAEAFLAARRHRGQLLAAVGGEFRRSLAAVAS